MKWSFDHKWISPDNSGEATWKAGRERNGHCPIRKKEGEGNERTRKEGGEGPGFLNPSDPTQTKNPDANFGVLPAIWASPPPPNDSTSSQLPFPPKLDSGGSPFYGEPTLSSSASSRAPTMISAIFEATTIDDDHGSTPHEPRNMSQALVGAAEHRRWRIEATLISRVLAGFK